MHDEIYNRRKVRLVNLVSFLMGFLDAFLIYILSAYIAPLVGTERLGAFYFVTFSLVLLALFFLQAFVRFLGKSRTLYLFLGITVVASAFLSSLPLSWLSLAILVLLIVAINLTWVSLDILLEGYSQDSVSGRVRGLYLTIMNLGLILAPFLSIKVLEKDTYAGIFFWLLVGYALVFTIAVLSFRNDNRVLLERIRLRTTFRKMLREKNLFHIYVVSFGMDFFYALFLVYMPLYLLGLGDSWNDLGIMFTLMLLPFILLQYPLGELADRAYGEKELIALSLLITAGSCLALGFSSGQSFLFVTLMLITTRVGIAGIEVLRDSYFYKQIDQSDADVIAFFRTTRSVANMVGAFISIALFLVFPLKSFLFLTAFVLLMSFISALKLEDTQSEKEVLESA